MLSSASRAAAFVAGSLAAVALIRRLAPRASAKPTPSPAIRPRDAERPAITDYSGKVVLVTGASSGIGAAIAVLLASRGATVAVHFSGNPEGAERTAAACVAAGSSESEAFRADLGADDIASVAEGLVAAVVARFGQLDVLINNAGIYEEKPFAPELSLTDFTAYWRRLMRVNVDAAAALGLAAAQQMLRQSGQAPGAADAPVSAIGSIIMLGSRGGFRGEPAAWAYGASKAAMHSLGGSMAIALGRYGIVVASVAPGFVETDRVAAKVAGEAGAAVRAQSSWGRVAAPAEVAEAVAFAAAFWRVPWVTGAVLDVNGASYLRV